MREILANASPMDDKKIASKKNASKDDIAVCEFRRLAQIYSWDMRLEEAIKWPERLLRRVMDIGTLQDIVSMENKIGRKPLVEALRNAEIGALRPKSWTFWHYRLGIVKIGEECPPYPVRKFA